MNNLEVIVSLSDNKISEAECLFINGFYDSVYNMAGYSVELLLKARISKTLNIDNFFDFGNRDKFINEDSILKPYKVHNYEQLFVLSGIYNEYVQILNDAEFFYNWSTIRKWKEDVRYLSGKNEQTVSDFINCVKYFSTWIKLYL